MQKPEAAPMVQSESSVFEECDGDKLVGLFIHAGVEKEKQEIGNIKAVIIRPAPKSKVWGLKNQKGKIEKINKH